MFCNKYKKVIEEKEQEIETLKAKVVKGQETVNKTNAFYKAKIAEINGSIPKAKNRGPYNKNNYKKP